MSHTHPGNKIVARNPITSFIIITVVFSYVLGIPVQIFVSSLLTGSNEVISVLIPRTITVYGPAFAAIIVTWFSTGRSGIKILLQKLVPGFQFIWWIILIPFFFALITFIAFAISGLPFSFLTRFIASDLGLLALQFVVQFLIVGIGEELGWRGWLLPRLAERYTMGTSVLLIILIWGCWHLPVFFNPPTYVIPWCMIILSLSLITTWIWYHIKGNVFVLAITHASFNTPVAFLENRLRETDNQTVFIHGWTFLGYTYLVMAIVLLFATRKLWKTRLTV